MDKSEADRIMTNCIPQKHKGRVTDALNVIFKEMTRNMEFSCDHAFDIIGGSAVLCSKCRRAYRLNK